MRFAALKCLALGAAGAILSLVTIGLLSSEYSDYRSRARTSNMLTLLKPLQAQVEEEILLDASISDAEPALAKAVGAVPAGHFDVLRVLSGGQILARGSTDGQVIVLLPTVEHGVVEWECIGGSRRDLLTGCR